MLDRFYLLRTLYSMLSSRQRRSAWALLALIVVGTLLETLGVGLTVPAIALLLQPDFLASHSNPWDPFGRFLHSLDYTRLVMVGMGVLVAIYAIKATFLTYLLWCQQHFVSGLQADFSRRLFAGYLGQPYVFHLQRNSAQLILNVTGEVSQLTGLFQSLLLLIAEIFVSIGIFTLLLSIEFVGTLVIAVVLGLAGWLFDRATRSHTLTWGEKRQFHEGLRIQHLQQGLGGVKDVKILGREGAFLKQYELHNLTSARITRLHQTLQQMPRLAFEVLAVGGLAILVVVMVSKGRASADIVATLGLFGAAAFRLMPAVNRIVFTAQTAHFLRPVVNTLANELDGLKEAVSQKNKVLLELKRDLTMESVSFCYPGSSAVALKEVSLVVPAGSTVGFIGESGAGKSTLVDILLGLMVPDSGTVRVDGVDVQENLRGWQDQIGYVPQSIFLTDDSMRRNIAFGLQDDQIDEDAVWRALRSAHLEEFARGLPEGLETVVGERGVRLSGGQRQRIGIARALYHDPAVLVLDEATSSLDMETESGVMEAVGCLHGKKTIIIVAHRLSTVDRCDYLYRLSRGRVVAEGRTTEVLAQ